MYPELKKYRDIERQETLSIANFGTGMGFYDFCYDGSPVNAFNLALTTQALEFDYKLMRHYKAKFRPGCKILLVLPYFIFCADDMEKYRGINERYYSILPEEDVAPRCNSTFAEYREKLTRLPEDGQRLELTVSLTEGQMKEQIPDALEDWLQSLHIISFQSGELSPEVQGSIERSKQWLGKIFSFCLENDLDPVVVVPPLSETLLAEISPEFRDSHFYQPLYEVIGDRDIPVLDYTREPEFCDPSLYGWPGFLVKWAARRFTRDVLKRVGIDGSAQKLPDRDCTGCGACRNACPHDALSLRPDERGFIRPQIDGARCVNCGRCLQVCPVCDPPDGKPMSGAYALYSKNEELRLCSSSGGAFSELARVLLGRGGCVAGAAYREDWSVEHRLIQQEEDLEPLRRSKYQQCDTGLVFRRVKEKLDEGREVLFCGTPCQTAGLRSFLGRDHEKLYLCDLICHGVMSPLVFQAYLQDLRERYGSEITSVWMRNKDRGWRSLATVVEFANGERYQGIGKTDPYMQLFLRHNTGIRPSCHACRFKGDASPADITLGDFWGLDTDNKGTSAVICRTEKGKKLVAEILGNCIAEEKSPEDVIRGNPCLVTPVQAGTSEDLFFDTLHEGGFPAACERLDGPRQERRHVVLFGCGKVAKEFYFAYQSRLTVDYALSNNPETRVFSPEMNTGYEVRRPEPKQGKGAMIVLCAVAWREMAEQLILLGYTPFEDFMDFQTARLLEDEKRIALFYGICHLRGLCDCLRRSADFMERYEPFYVANYLMGDAYEQLRLSFLAAHCDLFVYSLQLEQMNYQRNAALLERVKGRADCVCVPAAFWGGYFPQENRSWNSMNRYAVKCEGHPFTPFSYEDGWLDRCIDEGMTAEDVLEQMNEGKPYDRDFILGYLEKEWKRLKLQELQGDLRVTGYLMENYRKRRLYRNEAHMENEVLVHYAKQLLEKLGLRDSLEVPEGSLIGCSTHLILPCVGEALELEWDVASEVLELYTYEGWKRVSVPEYVGEYINCCREIKWLKERHILP